MDFIAFMLLIFKSTLVWGIVVSYVCYSYSKQILLSFGLTYPLPSLHFNTFFYECFFESISKNGCRDKFSAGNKSEVLNMQWGIIPLWTL